MMTRPAKRDFASSPISFRVPIGRNNQRGGKPKFQSLLSPACCGKREFLCWKKAVFRVTVFNEGAFVIGQG
jgi:hypothetical protein